jgi:hypothetical protein
MATVNPPKSKGTSLGRVQTIEATSKDLKKHIVISVLLILIGLVITIVFGQFAGLAPTVLGVIYYIAARMLIWWNHG